MVLLKLRLRPVEIINGDRNHARANLPAKPTLATTRWCAKAQQRLPIAAALTAPLLQQAQGGMCHDRLLLDLVHNSEPIHVEATHSIGKAIEHLAIRNADAAHSRVAVVNAQCGAASGEEGVELHPKVLAPGLGLSKAVGALG